MNKKENITLTPSDNVLMGKYSSNASNICVVLDSTLSGFTVAMPPLGSNVESIYWMYNLPTNGNGNDVTITARKINFTLTEITISPGECAIITGFISGYTAIA